VRREVTRVVTPGTVSEPELLDGKEENLLAGVVWDGARGAGAFLDVSTGQFFVRRWNDAGEGVDDLEVLRPREVLFDEEGLPAEVRDWVERRVTCWSALDGDRLYDRVARRRAPRAPLRHRHAARLRPRSRRAGGAGGGGGAGLRPRHAAQRPGARRLPFAPRGRRAHGARPHHAR
jgi:hypothetical protein